MSGFNGLAAKLGELSARVQESVDAVDFMFGTVSGISPLNVTVGQGMVLPNSVLVLSGSVVDLVAYENEKSGTVYYVPEHNLQLGDKVLLAKVKGGEAYVVLNRCYAMEVRR